MPNDKDDEAIRVFNTVTQALWALKDEEARKRVLRSTAVLLGYDFIEEADRARRRS